ncbi:MAG: PEP-CTERM sorting domain-containing protein [Kiritimatiellaceae bacterium]|nr:PEP-CTERM sorting domain-containing protein [Kiritimatiellaceae bacterium]
MKTTALRRKQRVILMTALMGLASSAWTANIEVFGVQRYLGGLYSDVPGSGGSSNFSTTANATGDFAVFDMRKDGVDFADLRVTFTEGSTTNVMLNRTSNSQGLTDTATISFLLTNTNAGYTASFRFDWFAPGSFSNGVYQSGSLISDPILYTTFDIDFNQLVGVQTNQLQYYALATNTLLRTNTTRVASYISFEDSGANSTYTEPRTASQFLTRAGTASHDIIMGKQSSGGNSLFMFEFRDPSQIIPDQFPPVSIPEPTAVGLIALGGIFTLTITRLRRRR